MQKCEPTAVSQDRSMLKFLYMMGYASKVAWPKYNSSIILGSEIHTVTLWIIGICSAAFLIIAFLLVAFLRPKLYIYWSFKRPNEETIEESELGFSVAADNHAVSSGAASCIASNTTTVPTAAAGSTHKPAAPIFDLHGFYEVLRGKGLALEKVKKDKVADRKLMINDNGEIFCNKSFPFKTRKYSVSSLSRVIQCDDEKRKLLLEFEFSKEKIKVLQFRARSADDARYIAKGFDELMVRSKSDPHLLTISRKALYGTAAATATAGSTSNESSSSIQDHDLLSDNHDYLHSNKVSRSGSFHVDDDGWDGDSVTTTMSSLSTSTTSTTSRLSRWSTSFKRSLSRSKETVILQRPPPIPEDYSA